MGVPIVASDIRGCREVVEDGRTGRLFPPRDVEALTTVVGDLLRDREARRAMGEAGRARVLAKYTETGTAQRLISFYEEILSQRRP